MHGKCVISMLSSEALAIYRKLFLLKKKLKKKIVFVLPYFVILNLKFMETEHNTHRKSNNKS